MHKTMRTFVTKWGSGGKGDGQFDLPTSFAIDSLGFVYVTDINNDRVQKFDNNGKYITKLGGLRGA
jgi:tripartite motif-containing protein 71